MPTAVAGYGIAAHRVDVALGREVNGDSLVARLDIARMNSAEQPQALTIEQRESLLKVSK